jgi:hypothetical protein
MTIRTLKQAQAFVDGVCDALDIPSIPIKWHDMSGIKGQMSFSRSYNPATGEHDIPSIKVVRGTFTQAEVDMEQDIFYREVGKKLGIEPSELIVASFLHELGHYYHWLLDAEDLDRQRFVPLSGLTQWTYSTQRYEEVIANNFMLAILKGTTLEEVLPEVTKNDNN